MLFRAPTLAESRALRIPDLASKMAGADGVLPERVSFSAQEERVLALWKALDAFGTSLRLSADKPLFTFFDGPPFATVRRAAAQPRRALCACRRH